MSRIVQRAREMRKAMSPQELALWLRLRALKSEGWRFRRQSPEPPYILDFVCRTAKLVVEVDGVQHAGAAQSAHDSTRDAELHRRGFRVLRFWASDVHNEMDGVLQTILSALGEQPSRRAARDTLPDAGREKIGARYRHLVRLGLRRPD
jgi:very-short-patch-repair endonuclease